MFRPVAFLVLIVLSAGCRSASKSYETDGIPDRSTWEGIAQEIRLADTDQKQAAAILRLHQLSNRAFEASPDFQSYRTTYFDRTGRMLLPGESVYDNAHYLLFMDFNNNDRLLFLPFLIELRGKEALSTSTLPY